MQLSSSVTRGYAASTGGVVPCCRVGTSTGISGNTNRWSRVGVDGRMTQEIVGRVYCFAKDQEGLHPKSIMPNYKLINHFIHSIRSSISKDDHPIHSVGLLKELYRTNCSRSSGTIGCTSYGCTQMSRTFPEPSNEAANLSTLGNSRTISKTCGSSHNTLHGLICVRVVVSATFVHRIHPSASEIQISRGI